MTPEENPQSFARVPRHIAIIMDGNGRWAKARGLPRLAGHRAGTENLRAIIKAGVDFGIQYLTFYAFSTENWSRPKSEVEGLMKIMADVFDREAAELHKEGARLIHIGHLDGLPPVLQDKVRNAVEMTSGNTRIIIVLAFNYGGRDEIIHAVKRILKDKIDPDKVDQDLISEYMFTGWHPGSGTGDPHFRRAAHQQFP